MLIDNSNKSLNEDNITKYWTVKKTREFLKIAWGDLGNLVIEPKDTVPQFGILVIEDGENTLPEIVQIIKEKQA